MAATNEFPAAVDVAIVGAGTAGLAALREVRKATENVLLVNDGPWGTTCARVGCMPSKALIAAAEAFHGRRRFDAFGLRGADGLTVDMPAVLRRVRALRDDFVSGVLAATADLGPRAVSARARLLGPGRLDVAGREVAAARIVLAPGSHPIVPASWRGLGTRIVTTDTLFDAADLPRRIGVVGLGPIGAEIAQALARLGREVTAFDGGDRVAGLHDPELREELFAALRAELAVHPGTEVELAADGEGVAMRHEGGDTRVDLVLAAVGRRPNLAGLGLETLGIPLDAAGLPPVDRETMQVADLPVYLAGDANGDLPLLHEAADEGHIAGLNAVAAGPVRVPRRTPLAIVFCDPEVAVVGTPLHRLAPGAAITGSRSFANQGRARTAGRAGGLLKVHAAREGGRLLGAEMAVPAAEHMAHLLALAIGRGLTVHDLLRMPFYHPVLEEGLRSALRGLAGQLPPCGICDLAGCAPLGAAALE